MPRRIGPDPPPALRQPWEFGVSPYQASDGPRCAASDDLARVEDPARVEGALDGGIEGQHVRADLGGQAGPFEQSDAVFAAHRPAEGDGGGDDVVEGRLRPAAGVVVAGGDDE